MLHQPPGHLVLANAQALENYEDTCADGVLHKPFELQEIYQLVNAYMPV